MFSPSKPSLLRSFFHQLGDVGLIFAETLKNIFRKPWEKTIFIQQLEEIGVRSLPVVSLTAAFGGLVFGLQTYIGDATRTEVLERLRVATAKIVAVTLPDPATSRQVIEQVRALSPETTIIVRARYHVHRWQLALAGAQVVVDEEEQVGMRMASEVRKKLSAGGQSL